MIRGEALVDRVLQILVGVEEVPAMFTKRQAYAYLHPADQPGLEQRAGFLARVERRFDTRLYIIRGWDGAWCWRVEVTLANPGFGWSPLSTWSPEKRVRAMAIGKHLLLGVGEGEIHQAENTSGLIFEIKLTPSEFAGVKWTRAEAGG